MTLLFANYLEVYQFLCIIVILRRNAKSTIDTLHAPVSVENILEKVLPIIVGCIKIFSNFDSTNLKQKA